MSDIGIKRNECVVLVYSCYKNKQMWGIFAYFFKKYWIDCQYRICLLTDKYDGSLFDFWDEVVECDADWLSMMKAGIIKMNDPDFFILFMDDYFITSKIFNSQIEKYIMLAKKYDCLNIRLHNTTFSEKKNCKDRNDLQYVVLGSAYSISLQVGIWNTKLFMRFCECNWSPWDFERIGSLRDCRKYQYTIMESVGWYFPYIEAVRNGKWMPQGYKFCTENCDLDVGFKKKMSFKESFVMQIKSILLNISPKYMLAMKNFWNERS